MKYDPETLLEQAIEIAGNRRGGQGNQATQAYICFGTTVRLVVPHNICKNLEWTPGESKISILHLPNNHWVACETRHGNLLSNPQHGAPFVQYTKIFPAGAFKEIICTVDSNILVFSNPLRIES